MRSRSTVACFATTLLLAFCLAGCDSGGSSTETEGGGGGGSSLGGAVLWASQTFLDKTVQRLDLESGSLRTFPIRSSVRRFLVDGVTTYGIADDTVLHRFPRTGTGPKDSCRLPWMPSGEIAVRDGRIYAYSDEARVDPRVVVVDAATCRSVDSTYASTRNNEYDGVRIDDDGLFILVQNGFQLLRLDPNTLRKTDSVPLGSPPSVPDSFAVLYGYGDLVRIGSHFWVLDSYRRRLIAIEVSPMRRVGHWTFTSLGLRNVTGPSLEAASDWLLVRDRDDTVKVLDPAHLLERRAGSAVRSAARFENRDFVAGRRHLLAEPVFPTNARMLDQILLPGLGTGRAIGLSGLSDVYALDD
jgi:hypothetical protein